MDPMSPRCAVGAASCVLILIGLTGCGLLNIGGMGGSAPAPPPPPVVEQPVVSPARSSPPVLPLAMMPANTADTDANSPSGQDDDTARLLEQKIKDYTRQVPAPADHPAAAT